MSIHYPAARWRGCVAAGIRRLRASCAIAGFGILSAGGALADDAPAAPSPANATQLPAVVVKGQSEPVDAASSGTKTDTPLTQTPQSISVISADDIASHGAGSMMEALRYTAGASVETYGPDPRGYDWVQLRGFDTFDSQYRDGMRLFDYVSMETYGLDRIEVLRGPSSVLYGQAVPGGLINGVSKLPTETAQHEVELSGGNYDSVLGQFDLGGPVYKGSDVDYRLVGLARSGGNQTHYPDGRDIPANRQYIEPAVTWHPSPDTRITLLGDWMHNVGQFANLASAPDGSPTHVLTNIPGFDTDDATTWSAGWQVEQRFLDGQLVFRHKLRKVAYSEENRYINVDGYDPDQPNMLDRTAEIDDNDARFWTSDNSLQWTTATGPVRHTVLGGVDYASNQHSERTYDGPAPALDISDPRYDQSVSRPTGMVAGSHEHNTQLGLYLQDQARWQQLFATASVRHDWVRNHTDDLLPSDEGAGNSAQNQAAFSGRLGLNWMTDSGIAPYASWSQSFQPNSGTDFSGRAFDPTVGRQVELGAKYATPKQTAVYTISLFRLTQDNALTKDAQHQNFSVQSGQIRSQGIEFEGRGDLTRTLDLSVSYSWDPVKIKRSNDTDGNGVPLQGKAPILTPRENASLWLGYTLHSGRLRDLKLNAGVRYIGANWGDDANTIRNSSLTLFDLAARYPRGHWELGANVNNLLDRAMFTYTPYGYYPTARRTISGSLRYSW